MASRRVFEWIRKAQLGFRYEISDLLNLEETDSQAPFVVPNLRTRLVKICAGIVLELVIFHLSYDLYTANCSSTGIQMHVGRLIFIAQVGGQYRRIFGPRLV